MNRTGLHRKMALILANERERSRRLALTVIDKPEPRIWMIFIPVTFVLYFWKLKEYENALKTFAEHHLLPRQKMLEAVLAANECGMPVDIERLVDLFGDMAEEKRALCKEWLTGLTEYFQLLLGAEGDCFSTLLCSAYLNRANYLRCCQQIGEAEAAFNRTLLEKMYGDSDELYRVNEEMTEGMRMLRIKAAESVFP